MMAIAFLPDVLRRVAKMHLSDMSRVTKGIRILFTTLLYMVFKNTPSNNVVFEKNSFSEIRWPKFKEFWDVLQKNSIVLCRSIFREKDINRRFPICRSALIE